jgi:flavodoxin
LIKVLIVYDSVFGNTGKIAQAMGDALGTQHEVQTLQVSNVKPEQLAAVQLLIVGSPTRKFKPTGATNNFIKNIPKNGLDGVKAAAFDTRSTKKEIEKSSVLPFFIKLFGYAAQPISEKLQKKGADLAMSPEGFFVEGVEGPLQAGELERAAEWAKQAAKTM